MNTKKFEIELGGREITVELGRLAMQADGSLIVSCGETVILATAVMSKNTRPEISYFPLTVDFDEKLYAAGRIKGSRWVKREGRPTDEAILSSRLIDRTIRPLFNHRLRNEVQVILTILSFDGQNDPDVLGILAASTALLISGIPWNGPVAGVRIGRNAEKNLIINPTYAERDGSDLDVVVAGPGDLINMIEAGSNEVSEKDLLQAIAQAQTEIKKLIDFQKKIATEMPQKQSLANAPSANEALRREIKSWLGGRLEKALFDTDPKMTEVENIKKEMTDWLVENRKNGADLSEAAIIFEEELRTLAHNSVLKNKKRPDGRQMEEIRKLNIEVGVLPRTHGSAIFQRGATQALCLVTLGAPGLEQSIESMEFVGTKRYIHHYNSPPFSSGETGRLGFPGRREIGHGALAEKAILPMIPSKEEFPYAIRVVTEITSSNGSTSMASVCGSTLALMDAGVKIKKPVAGIAMGLFVADETDPEKEYQIVTDLQGAEDHYGDMDFKIAGTAEGVNAMQMDVKVVGLTVSVLERALTQAHQARLAILEAMRKIIPQTRPNLSPYAPKILTLKINPDKIRDVIGSGGKTIHQITDATGATIDIEEDGLIYVTAENESSARQALEWIKNITYEVTPGETFKGKIVRILNFGAFAEILPGQQGLIHISELSSQHVNRVEDVVKIGDIVPVKVKNIDSEGRINLSLKDALADSNQKPK